jgi:hypothetical protein
MIIVTLDIGLLRLSSGCNPNLLYVHHDVILKIVQVHPFENHSTGPTKLAAKESNLIVDNTTQRFRTEAIHSLWQTDTTTGAFFLGVEAGKTDVSKYENRIQPEQTLTIEL